jgi:hypothetical protein
MTAQELFTSICERIPDALARHKVPGVVLGITSEGQELVRGFGVTNLDRRRRRLPDPPRRHFVSALSGPIG